LALCLLGTTATTAQAEEGASWKIEGKDASSLSAAISIKEIESHDATLTTKVGGTKVEVLCTGAQPIGIKLEANGSITSGSQVRFSGCLTKLNGTTSGPCEPNNGGKEPGAILSKALKGLLITHEGAGLLRLEPKEGETLATIETTETCSVGKEVPLIGKLTLKDSSLETEAETHLVVEGSLTELWVLSKTEEHKATIGGSMIVQLAGIHAGKKWKGAVPKEGEEEEKVGGEWLILHEGTTVVPTKESPATIGAEIENGSASVLTTISKTSEKILCTESTLVNARLIGSGQIEEGAKVIFKGCKIYINGTENKSCVPNAPGSPEGTIETNKFSATITSHLEEELIKVTSEGETLIAFEVGELCPLPETIPIRGVLDLKDCEGKATTHQVSHLVEQGPLTHLYALTDTVEHAATVDGSLLIFLSGAYLGDQWAGDAN
jgi:hypothetical protein